LFLKVNQSVNVITRLQYDSTHQPDQSLSDAGREEDVGQDYGADDDAGLKLVQKPTTERQNTELWKRVRKKRSISVNIIMVNVIMVNVISFLSLKSD
jgi:hypothetical protein